jgi:hypothetical protein
MIDVFVLSSPAMANHGWGQVFCWDSNLVENVMGLGCDVLGVVAVMVKLLPLWGEHEMIPTSYPGIEKAGLCVIFSLLAWVAFVVRSYGI